jgi:predicted nucleotidyltransferase
VSLGTLARELEVSQRTLRRAADLGLIRGERVSERNFRVTLREENYLRRHWQLLGGLRRALRTEPNVRLAVLFGSAARGELHAQSDLDVLVDLRHRDPRHVAALAQRMSEAVGRAVQPVRVSDAERRPVLLAEALADGRVLIDRDDHWRELKRRLPAIARQAARAAVPFGDALASIPPLVDDESP